MQERIEYIRENQPIQPVAEATVESAKVKEETVIEKEPVKDYTNVDFEDIN